MTKIEELQKRAEAIRDDEHVQSVMLECMGMLGLTPGTPGDIMGIIGMAYLWGVEDGKQRITFCVKDEANSA